MVISHNMMAIFAAGDNKITGKRLSTSAEKLSSGYRINRAADDAAGLFISEEMRRQIRGLDRGADNINEGINYCQVADGALAEVQDMLQRMNELAIQAANGTNSQSDRAAINDEIAQLKTETNRIFKTTKYNDEYIFRMDDDDYVAPYDLDFSGYPDNIYIYNDSYDETTNTAAYGGIAYNGTRYAWSSISAAMYDETTGLFNNGTYSLKADDGTWLTFTCTSGAEPPKVSLEYKTSVDTNGIHINGELIPWSKVTDENGDSFDPNQVEPLEYSFTYHGVTVSFTPEIDDEFSDVIQKLSNITWKSTYRLPYEDTALYGDFSNTEVQFNSNETVKNYLAGTLDDTMQYVVRASDGTNGTTDGIWLELNGTVVSGSEKTWVELGITNWGDQSTDIWEDKTYTYEYQQSDANTISFSFQLINETSKDSVIDALDDVKLNASNVVLESHTGLDISSASSNVLSAEVLSDSLALTLAEEYGLGRDYTDTADAYAQSAISYDTSAGNVSVKYTGNVDGVTTTKSYSNTDSETDAIVADIMAQIKEAANYLSLISARSAGGATSPLPTDLTTVIGQSSITGGGSDTYLENVFSFDAINNTSLITTLTTANGDYAGASIDFSGLGSSYNLADLIGTGFNTTCQTCSNHYSVQFMTQSTVNTSWDSVDIDGNTYYYSMEQQGSNYTLYVDVESMYGSIGNGTDFTNALVQIFDDAGYDFHFTQYATYNDDAELYVFDNRTYYVTDGASTATEADFQPYAYGTDTVASFTVSLYDDENAAESVRIAYEYDFSDLFANDNLKYDVSENTNGNYVYDSTSGTYVLYDSANASHANAVRYNINSVSLDIGTYSSLDDYLDSYIRDTILKDSLSGTTMSLISDYSGYRVSTRENDNAAMITEYNTPYQLTVAAPKEEDAGSLLIQCTAKTNDFISLEKQKLSLRKLGISKLSVATETKATKAITLIGDALSNLNTVRSRFGSYQNRLEHAHAINENSAENTQSSESTIRDTDMAKEIVRYSINNVLAQAGQAVLAQANQSTQGVLSLLG